MKTKLVDTITSNEEHVRMKIYDGELTPDKAYQELLRIEQEQRKSDRFFAEERVKRLLEIMNGEPRS